MDVSRESRALLTELVKAAEAVGWAEAEEVGGTDPRGPGVAEKWRDQALAAMEHRLAALEAAD